MPGERQRSASRAPRFRERRAGPLRTGECRRCLRGIVQHAPPISNSACQSWITALASGSRALGSRVRRGASSWTHPLAAQGQRSKAAAQQSGEAARLTRATVPRCNRGAPRSSRHARHGAHDDATPRSACYLLTDAVTGAPTAAPRPSAGPARRWRNGRGVHTRRVGVSYAVACTNPTVQRWLRRWAVSIPRWFRGAGLSYARSRSSCAARARRRTQTRCRCSGSRRCSGPAARLTW